MADFVMPALGADMATGKVVQWLVAPGDTVRRGDVIAVVETHKGAIDVECFLDGVIADLAALDVEMPVGAVLAHVSAPGEAPAGGPGPRLRQLWPIPPLAPHPHPQRRRHRPRPLRPCRRCRPSQARQARASGSAPPRAGEHRSWASTRYGCTVRASRGR